MSKHKINKFLCIAGILVSSILIAHDFIGDSEYKTWNIFTHIGLFIFSVYFFYLNKKHEHKMKEDSQKSVGSNGEVLDINMLEVEEKVDLKKGMQTLWIIWGAMLGSLVVYIIVCHAMVDKIDVNKWTDFPFATFKNILYIIIVVELFAIHFIRKLMLKVRHYKQEQPITKETSGLKYQPALSKYTSALIVSLAIAESIGIYGVVLFFKSKDFQSLYIFMAISAIAMFIYRPKVEEVEKLALNLQEPA